METALSLESLYLENLVGLWLWSGMPFVPFSLLEPCKFYAHGQTYRCGWHLQFVGLPWSPLTWYKVSETAKVWYLWTNIGFSVVLSIHPAIKPQLWLSFFLLIFRTMHITAKNGLELKWTPYATAPKRAFIGIGSFQGAIKLKSSSHFWLVELLCSLDQPNRCTVRSRSFSHCISMVGKFNL